MDGGTGEGRESARAAGAPRGHGYHGFSPVPISRSNPRNAPPSVKYALIALVAANVVAFLSFGIGFALMNLLALANFNW